MNIRALLFGSSHASATDLGLLLGRVIMGLSLLLGHGIGKIPPAEGFLGGVAAMGFPAPTLFAWLAAIAETAGAVLIAIGLFTRPAALFVTGHFLFIILVAHGDDPFGDRELPVLFLAFALIFLCTGAGRFSLDAIIHRPSRHRAP